MPRLDFYVNYELQATVKLAEPEIVIGRDPDCAIAMPDPKVSRIHAVLRASDGGHEIENRGVNGTKVNGRPVGEPQLLEPGDAIFISHFVLIYQSDDAPAAEDVQTVLI